MRLKYRLFKGHEAIALHEGRIEVSSGTVAFYDHLGLVEAYAPGEWTFVGRVEDDD